jgi:hypothetical protein
MLIFAVQAIGITCKTIMYKRRDRVSRVQKERRKERRREKDKN